MDSKAISIVLAIIGMVNLVNAIEYYSAELSKVDSDAIIRNETAVNAIFGCFMDQSPCAPIAARIKEVLPEVMEQTCAKCTADHKHNAGVYMNHLKNKLPSKYEAFKAKYDPKSKYIEKLEAEVFKFI